MLDNLGLKGSGRASPVAVLVTHAATHTEELGALVGARALRGRSPGAGGHSVGSSLFTVQPLGQDLAPVAPLPGAALSRRLVLAQGRWCPGTAPSKGSSHLRPEGHRG